ncbi:YbbR-like domain-containing protein [Odoribacter lunatus]|uniref:YbbR-like domain-containing protein n=1 Tax=Odoribacter lunatus TaxID=2941335 RepID=UPI002041803E|nr:YbbR-like domain-containing protein [Odoribacter lunatus]
MIIKNITDQLKNIHLQLDRHVITYGICVVIASVLWFLNALNKDYSSQISYPVKYTDFPQGKYLVSTPPQRITLEVKAKGFALLAHKIKTSFRPIVIPINSLSNKILEQSDVFEYTFPLQNIKDKISSQLNTYIKLSSIQPEKIEFIFSPAVSKKVAVRPVVQYSLKQLYILKDGILCTPDSIKVSGPALIIDTLKYVYTKPWDAGEIKRELSKTVSLAPMPGVQFNDTPIRLDMSLERYTEGNKTIPIKVLNLPSSMDIKLFPNTVEVSYEIGLSKYDLVQDEDFSFTVDYRKIKSGSLLPVQATRFPAYIQELKYSPQKVEFILEPK